MTDILVVAEQHDGRVGDISGELITVGRDLATDDDDLHVLVIGSDAADLGEDLNRQGVAYVHTVEYEDGYNHDVYASVVHSLFRSVAPRLLLMAHTLTGMDYAAAAASASDTPLLTNITGVTSGESLTVSRKMYDSKVDATVEIDQEPVALTVREGAFESTDEAGAAEIIGAEPDLANTKIASRILERRANDKSEIDITSSEFIIAVGRGIEDEEHIDLIYDVSDVLGATVAGSRPLVEQGWLPKERQVGQSGQVVSPSVYLAVGISGAIEHLVGMKGSETIIAVNTDPSAPIFDVADYGIVGDLFDVLPAIADELS